MPQAVLASSPISIVVVQSGRAYHRRPNKPDAEIGADSTGFRQSAISKHGMIEIEGEPEIGDGFPFLVFSAGKFTAKSIEPGFRVEMAGKLGKFFDGVSTKFNPHHDARGRFASGSGSKIKPSVGSATSTTPPAAFIAAVAQSKIDNEGWEERLVAHQAVQERLLKKIDAALEKDDNGTALTPEQKAAYRSAFVNVTDNMNNHAIEALEQHLDDVKFYSSAQSLTDKLVGLDRMEPGKVILGAWSGTTDGANGSLHLDGGPGGKHDKFAAQQVYAHEVAHAIDWVPGSVTKIPVHKLKVSADEAEKTILARIDKLPISAQQKEAERANVLWNLGEPDSFAAIGVKTDDLYQLTGHRELHRPGREISRGAKWINAHNAEIDALDAKGAQTFPLSKYATTSASEGFAEFGRLVFTAPREAKRQYPKCWAVWLEHGLVGNPAQQKKASAE